MKYPTYLKSSLDLLPLNEKKQALISLNRLFQLEKELPSSLRYFKKIIGNNKYIYKVSRQYRAVIEMVENEINIIDIIHHDKIKLVIRRGKCK